MSAAQLRGSLAARGYPEARCRGGAGAAPMVCIHRMAYAWLMAGNNATAKAVWALGAFTGLARRVHHTPYAVPFALAVCRYDAAVSFVRAKTAARDRGSRSTRHDDIDMREPPSDATVMARCGRRAETE